MKEKNHNLSIGDNRNSVGSSSNKFGLNTNNNPSKNIRDEKMIKRESDTTMMQKPQRITSEKPRLYDSVGRPGITKFSSRFSTSAGSENRDDDQSFERMILMKEIPDEVTHDMLFNLCSLYGNIYNVWVHSDLKLALVCFECSSQTAVARQHLNGLVLFGNEIKIRMAVDDAAISEMVFDGEEKDFRNNPNQRFKIPGSKNYNNVNPPSTTIHLSNLPENYDLFKLADLFSCVAIAQNVSYFSGSNTMALANFDTVADATQVLVTFHNYNIHGR